MGGPDNFGIDAGFSEGVLADLCAKASDLENRESHITWLEVAKLKSAIDYAAADAAYSLAAGSIAPAAAALPVAGTSYANQAFAGFIAEGYWRLLSLEVPGAPALVSKAWDYIGEQGHERAALIVVDGMSLFDYRAMLPSFSELDHELSCTYAMIPTVTPISRQSLVAGKLPRDLANHLSLDCEEAEFLSTFEARGFARGEVLYSRGVKDAIDETVRAAVVIVNDVDEIVHRQRHGRLGMLRDLAADGCGQRIAGLVGSLQRQGFQVYLSADHGNAGCVGVGEFASDVGAQTRATRMAVYRDPSCLGSLLLEHSSEYPGHFLPDGLSYRVCHEGVSFDPAGVSAMTHGGITLDEVIVPFIKFYSSEV